MISEHRQERLNEIIDTFIREDKNFALYRVPNEPEPHFLMQTSGVPDCLYNLNQLNGRKGFVIAPFHIDESCPIIVLHPDIESIPFDIQKTAVDDPVKSDDNNFQSIPENELKTDYSKHFEDFTRPLLKNELDKLVLSRQLKLSKTEKFSPARAFYTACKRYTRSYVYLFHTQKTGTWLGSTPEILLSDKSGTWQTVALAGTQRLSNGILPESWDNKNYREQQIVAKYVRNQLATLGIEPEEKGPYTVQAAALAHLKSDFYFSLPSSENLGDVLELLHPTPAVSGLPKEKAYHFILEKEGHDRRYYSGFIGILDPSNGTDLYVNLRCMEIQPTKFVLYAGGGLLSSSELESEWEETEDKLQTMRTLIY